MIRGPGSHAEEKLNVDGNMLETKTQSSPFLSPLKLLLPLSLLLLLMLKKNEFEVLLAEAAWTHYKLLCSYKS